MATGSCDQANSGSVLCQLCHTIFHAETEPAELDEEYPQLAKIAFAHHSNVQSLRDAAAGGCHICREVDAKLPAGVKREHGPATRYALAKMSAEKYLISIFLNVDGPDSVFYFQVSKVTDDTVLNVPADQRPQLVQKWSQDCFSGSGKHASCHRYRNAARQHLPHAPRRLVQLKSDGTEGEATRILFRLREYDNTDRDQTSAAYATVSHHWTDGDRSSLATAAASNGAHDWNTIQQLPRPAQQAAAAAVAGGVQNLWLPILCSHRDGTSDDDDDDARTGDIYAQSAFNIAVLDGDGCLFPAPGETESDALPVVRPAWAPDQRLVIYQRDLFWDAYTRSPLSTSATFLREMLLAPATLYCCASGTDGGRLWWQCIEGTLYGDAAATGVGSRSPSALEIESAHDLNWPDTLQEASAATTPHEAFAEQLATFWTSVVTVYANARARTAAERAAVVDDVAAHVWTLASAGNPRAQWPPPPLSYAHGAWTDGLVEQMAWWCSHGDAPLPRRLSRASAGPQQPTWSWLSVDGPVQFEFILSVGPPGLRTTFMAPEAPRARRVVTAHLQGAAPGVGGGTRPAEGPVQVQASGRLIGASLDGSAAAEQGLLNLDGVYGADGVDGEATVAWDCVEELDGARQAEKAAGGLYFAWPMFVHVYDAGQIEARGLLLRPVENIAARSFARCGWFRYSLGESGQSSDVRNPMADLGRGDTSQHVQFAIV